MRWIRSRRGHGTRGEPGIRRGFRRGIGAQYELHSEGIEPAIGRESVGRVVVVLRREARRLSTHARDERREYIAQNKSSLERKNQVRVGLLVQPGFHPYANGSRNFDDATDAIQRNTWRDLNLKLGQIRISVGLHFQTGNCACPVQLKQRASEPPTVIVLVGFKVLDTQ